MQSIIIFVFKPHIAQSEPAVRPVWCCGHIMKEAVWLGEVEAQAASLSHYNIVTGTGGGLNRGGDSAPL